MNNFFNQIEFAKTEIEGLLNNHIILEQDIEMLSHLTFEETLELLKKQHMNEKNRYLYLIYINPYLICTDKPYIDIDIIAKLLVTRFNLEMSEINNKYQAGEINKIECHNMKHFYKNLYFKSSMTGRKIMNYYRDEIVDNKTSTVK